MWETWVKFPLFPFYLLLSNKGKKNLEKNTRKENYTTVEKRILYTEMSIT